MARKAAPKTKKSSVKVGSSRPSAKAFADKKDFGVAQKPRLREFARRKSRDAKFRPGGSHESDGRQEIGTTQQSRVSGVGKRNAGPGGASAGDVDPDVVGVGDGRGLSQGGPDANVSDAEWSDGSSNEMASGPKAKGENQKSRGGGRKR